MSSPKDLPSLDDFAPDDNTARLIRERLGATAAANEAVQEAAAAAAKPAAGLEADESPFGVVEKIDFDSLVFDTDSE